MRCISIHSSIPTTTKFQDSRRFMHQFTKSASLRFPNNTLLLRSNTNTSSHSTAAAAAAIPSSLFIAAAAPPPTTGGNSFLIQTGSVLLILYWIGNYLAQCDLLDEQWDDEWDEWSDD